MFTLLSRKALVLAIAMLLGLVQAQALPAKAPPQGMRSAYTGGQGRVLYTTLSGSHSATKLAQAVRIGIQGYFDAPPVFQAGVRNPGDTQFQAAFSARLGGVPVVGLLVVTITGQNGGGAALLFDSRSRARQSFPAMQKALVGSGGQGRPTSAPLSRTPLPDGSGYVGLAPGWRVVNSYKGTADIAGPGGTVMGLGGYQLAVPAQLAQYPGYQGGVPISTTDPVGAMVEAAAHQGIRIQVLDRRPTPWQNGQAAFVRYWANVGGTRMDGFGLFALMQYDTNSYIFYQSYVYAPSQVFSQILPTALQTWASWSINPAVYTERLMAAAQSMRETGDIITSAYNDRQRTYDSINKGWDQYIRDTATLEYIDGRRTEDVSANFANWLVKEDPVNWRIVPASELIPH